jgi:cardiolipin synthase
MSRESWSEERLFFDKETYFTALFEALGAARLSVEMETYIFEPDPTGLRVLDALRDAARRGVRVRLVVDGVGSWFWIGILRETLGDSGVEFKVYHPVSLFRTAFARLNRRLHRKVCIVDGKTVFLGSFNITHRHHRDTGVRLSGPGVRILEEAFKILWEERFPTRKLLFHESSRIRLNLTRRFRVRWNREFVRRIREAKYRVWITNAYFVPPWFLLRALCSAGLRGVDVRLLLPAEPDYRFMKWLSEAYYRYLLLSGVRVFEYRARFLHAKSILVDEGFAMVGSTNLNHRSLMHDLEVDAELGHTESFQALEEQFKTDLRDSTEVREFDPTSGGWGIRLLRWLVIRLRYWA